MIVNHFLANANPFIDAYLQSDFVGKLIFIALIALSVISWVLIIYKWRHNIQAQKTSQAFHKIFMQKQATPLQIDSQNGSVKDLSPFYELYHVLKQHTLELLNRNHHLAALAGRSDTAVALSATDIAAIDAQLTVAIADQKKKLEEHLYWLSTIVRLAPFIGLLGTVWGILTTFGELQGHVGGGAHQMALGGLSLALATTVIGLVDAIPALIGFNYLKNGVHSFEIEMNSFATKILSAVELQYRGEG